MTVARATIAPIDRNVNGTNRVRFGDVSRPIRGHQAPSLQLLAEELAPDAQLGRVVVTLHYRPPNSGR